MNQRLQQKILSHIFTDENSGCWIWKGQIANSGYGKLKIKDEVHGTKAESAKEVSYMAFIEPIAQDTIIRQNCNNRLCVNPEHLIAQKV